MHVFYQQVAVNSGWLPGFNIFRSDGATVPFIAFWFGLASILYRTLDIPSPALLPSLFRSKAP